MDRTTNKSVVELEVRDYECDIEGIVNNAVYLNYLEHARHEFIKQLGTDFLSLHKRGFDAVVTRIEIDYRATLRSGDAICIATKVEKRGRYRFLFDQTIERGGDEMVVAKALVYAAFLNGGRPTLPPPEFSSL